MLFISIEYCHISLSKAYLSVYIIMFFIDLDTPSYKLSIFVGKSVFESAAVCYEQTFFGS